MPCYKPLKGYRSKELNENGKRPIVFNLKKGFIDMPVEIPCGQCIGCRLERSRQWAIRCVHEASLWEENCFITLTYNDENLPPDNSLVLEDFQKFMKKLRKKFGSGIRFFHCGEYGENFGRPHYHACLFNFDFADKKIWKRSLDNPLYVSEDLDKLWGKGYATIGEVSFESAAYVARYITKKITGERAEDHYSVIDSHTGEIRKRKPEYVTMSRRPGIAKDWFLKFKDDVYPDDFIVINGRKMKPPKFYDRSYEIISPSDYRRIKFSRVEKAKEFTDNNTWDRLEVREKIQLMRFDRLKRSYENET